MKLPGWVLAGSLLAPLAAAAETVYVIDTLRVGLRDARDGAIVKSVETGTMLEVLERDERFVRVRDRTGAEGWLEVRYVSAEVPARTQLAKTQEELNKVRAQLAAAPAEPRPAAPLPLPAEAEPGLDYVWLLVALGMLGAGFVAGILWHRESIRRRMGGMYLRI